MKIFTRSLLDEIATKAASAPRGRAHYNIHESPADVLQRFFVVADSRSYFRPHRHRTRSEMAVVLRGSFDVLTFDDEGTVEARWNIGEGSEIFAYETPQMTWHTLIAATDGSAFLEFKQGPYDPAVAAEFAPWAPAEAEVEAPHLLEWLRQARPGERYRA